MSAAMSRHDNSGLLVELLTPKCRPRSPLSNPHSPLGRSGSLRRLRQSPCSSPSFVADRELSTLLGMVAPDVRTAYPFDLPELRCPEFSLEATSPTCNFPQDQQPQAGPVAPETPSSPPKTSLSAQNHATATYLSYDATQTQVNPTNKVTVKTTSHSNQQSDQNNNKGSDQRGVGRLSDRESGSKGELASRRIAGSEEKLECSTSTSTGNISVVLEKRKLVPELKVFDKVISRLHGLPQDGKNSKEERVKKAQNNSQIGKADKSETSTSSSRKEEEEGREEKVVVWCVTGVCEAAGELTHTDNAHDQKDQCRSDNQGGSQQASSSQTNRKPSKPQPANEKPVPVPISSQPVPASHPASSPRWRPAEPASAKGASKGTKEAKGSTNEKRVVKTDQSTGGRSKNKTNESKEAASSTKTSSKSSTKNVPTSKTQSAVVKPADNANKSKPVRTLTNSENQGLRRVVPISRTNQGGAPALGRRPGTPIPFGLTVSSASFRRGEKASTAPSSRRSSIHKTPDPKDSKESKDKKVSGTTQKQNQDLQRKPSVQKPATKSKPTPPPEEKMCRSTLRSLSIGSSGSVSAPVSPLHRPPTPSPLPIPSFARSTAASFFRRSFASPTPSPSPHTGPPKSPKTTTTTTTSSPLSRTGSLRVSATSRSSNPLKPPSSTSPSKPESTKASPRSPRHLSPAPPKGHRRNDSGSFSDKSSHSRDSSKSTRPSWR